MEGRLPRGFCVGTDLLQSVMDNVRYHAGPSTRFGKRRSDRFAIFCQSIAIVRRGLLILSLVPLGLFNRSRSLRRTEIQSAQRRRQSSVWSGRAGILLHP